jgi:hypothetical protein
MINNPIHGILRMKISFKQFLEESKQQLLRAADAAPIHSKKYYATKYSNFRLGETVISIRPRYQIIVEWQYQDMLNPQPINIQVIQQNNDIVEIPLSNTDPKKLVRWLNNNTREEQSPLKGIPNV